MEVFEWEVVWQLLGGVGIRHTGDVLTIRWCKELHVAFKMYTVTVAECNHASLRIAIIRDLCWCLWQRHRRQ